MTKPIPFLLALALLLHADWVTASTVVIGNGAPRLRLRIGQTGGGIALVTFTVPAASVGNGTAINGTNAASGCAANQIFIDAEARANPANIRTATLTANSSLALTSGANTIAFSEIAWTASGFAPTTIPSGAFTAGAGQVLVTFMNSRRARQCHAFRYLNSNIVAAGTYNGRVTYTLTMP